MCGTRRKMEASTSAVLFLFTIIHSGWSQQSFIVTPRDAGVLVGETTTMECTIGNKIGNVYWEKNGIIIAGENANTGRIRITSESRDSGQYNLRITGTQTTDSGQYKCMVTDNDILGGYRRSQPATLSVVEPSSDNAYPQCVQNIMSDVKEGDILTLTCVCKMNSISDDLDLEWLRGSDKVAGQGTIYQLNDDYLVRRYHFVVDGYDHDVVYACIAKGSSFSTPVSCTTGPLKVQFTPKINMDPKVAYAYLGDDIIVRCNALANPDIQNYFWLYDGQNVTSLDDRLDVDDDGHSLIIRNLNSNDHQVNITCVVVNLLGASSQETSIEIVNLPSSKVRMWWLIAAIVLAVAILILVTYTFWECSKQRKDIIRTKNIKMWVEGGTPPYHPSDTGSTSSRRTRPAYDPPDTIIDDAIPLGIRESTRYSDSHEQTEFIEIQETHIGETNPQDRATSGLTGSPKTITPVEMHNVPSDSDDNTERNKSKNRVREQRQRSPDGSENPDADELPKKQGLVYADLDFERYGKRRTILREAYDSGVGIDSTEDVQPNTDYDKVEPIAPVKTVSEPAVYAQIRKSNRPRRVKIINKDSTTDEFLY